MSKFSLLKTIVESSKIEDSEYANVLELSKDKSPTITINAKTTTKSVSAKDPGFLADIIKPRAAVYLMADGISYRNGKYSTRVTKLLDTKVKLVPGDVINMTGITFPNRLTVIRKITKVADLPNAKTLVLSDTVKGRISAANMASRVDPDEGAEFFMLGYWTNAYRSNDNEYFWGTNYESRKEAKAAGDRIHKRGYPKRFHDWSGGGVKVFTDRAKFLAAAKKVDLNPNLD